jgi:hypothetical protein
MDRNEVEKIPLCPYHGNDYKPEPCGVCEFILLQIMKQKKEGEK